MADMNPEQLKQLKEAVDALVETFNDLSISMKGATQDAKAAAKAMEDSREASEDGLDGLRGFGQTVANLFGGDAAQGRFEFLEDLGKMATGAGDAKFSLTDLGGALKEGMGKLNAYAAILNVCTMALTAMATATTHLALATDRAMTDFNKSTGAARKYGDMMFSLETQHRANQISMEDVATTMEGLMSNFGAIKHASEDNQRAFAENTMILQELGVSAENTASNLNMLVTGLGMSAEAANRVQNEMFLLAQDIGMSPNSVSAALSESMPKLAAFGKQAPEVFKKLQVNAQKAGMSVNQILSITEKFDRFDTAAESVGKLNAILGGPYMSVTKMIRTTDPTERMRLMSQAARDAGKSFDSMAYYERKALTAAMGLEDVSQLALVMNGRFEEMAPKTLKSAAELEALALQTAEFNSVAEVFTSTLQQLIANLGPAVKGFKNMMGVVGTLLSSFPALKLAIAGVAMAVSAAAVVIMVAMGMTGIGGIIVIIGVIVTGLTAAAGAIYSFLGSWKDLVSEMSGAAGIMGRLVAGIKLFFLLTPIGQIWALVQVFSHWQEIMEFVVLNLGDLVGQFAAVTDRASALTAGSSAATQSFIEWGDVLEWVGAYIYFAGQQMLTLYDAIVTLAEGAMYVWNNFTVLRYGIYTLAAAVGIIVGVFVGLAALPYLIGAGIMYLLQRFKLLKPVLIIIGVITAAFVASLMIIPLIVATIVGGIVYLGYVLGKFLYPYIKRAVEIQRALNNVFIAFAKIVAQPFMTILKRNFETLKKVMSPVLSVFNAISDAVKDVNDGIKSLANTISTKAKVLEPYLEVAQAVANPGAFVAEQALGPDAGQKISDYGFSKASSMASGNKELSNAIDSLAQAVGANSNAETVVQVEGSMAKFFNFTEKKVNRKASGKPVYGNKT